MDSPKKIAFVRQVAPLHVPLKPQSILSTSVLLACWRYDGWGHYGCQKKHHPLLSFHWAMWKEKMPWRWIDD